MPCLWFQTLDLSFSVSIAVAVAAATAAAAGAIELYVANRLNWTTKSAF